LQGVVHHEAPICIGSDHPALPGHFPGLPVVPGVVLLDRLVQAAESHLGRPLQIVGLAGAKFLAPLLPEQRALCSLEIDGARLRFRVERDGQPVAQGAFALAADGAA
jgi:3-hydroxyacyl-[acyl-carrier-protein] dehydratase